MGRRGRETGREIAKELSHQKFVKPVMQKRARFLLHNGRVGLHSRPLRQGRKA